MSRLNICIEDFGNISPCIYFSQNTYRPSDKEDKQTLQLRFSVIPTCSAHLNNTETAVVYILRYNCLKLLKAIN